MTAAKPFFSTTQWFWGLPFGWLDEPADILHSWKIQVYKLQIHVHTCSAFPQTALVLTVRLHVLHVSRLGRSLRCLARGSYLVVLWGIIGINNEYLMSKNHPIPCHSFVWITGLSYTMDTSLLSRVQMSGSLLVHLGGQTLQPSTCNGRCRSPCSAA